MFTALHLPALSASEMVQVGNKIFRNETSGNKNKLVFWNPKEAFPSMGIGHFIWLPSDCNISFLSDTFKKFLKFCAKKGIILPSYLQKNKRCPWSDRADFVRSETNSDSWQMRKVRAFLAFHMRVQAEFVLVNFLKDLPAVIDKLPESLQEEAIEYCNLLLETPEGCFALIDYNHFKGQGLGEYPEYNHQGWGLKQVVERALHKDWQSQPLEMFIEAAKETLANRVENAPIEKREVEKSFIPGWNVRLDRYKA